MKRTPLKPRSAKRVAEDREREKAKVVVRERAKGRCEAVPELLDPDLGHCGGPFDFHEVLTRARGGSITDPSNILYVCRRHHDWITTHPKESVELGLVRNSWTEPTTKANLHVQVGERVRRFPPTPSTALRATNAQPGRTEHPVHQPGDGVAPGAPSVTLRLIYPARPWTLNGERKMSRYERANVVKEWRDAFALLALRCTKLAWANVEVRVYLRDGRDQDVCGAIGAYKAAQDGIVDAGVLPDDGPEYVRQVTFYPPKLRSYDALELVLRGEPA